MNHPPIAVRDCLRSFLFLLLTLGLAVPAGAQTAPDAATVALCESCHGEIGLPLDAAIPILSGQEFYYLYVQLKDFKSGNRASPVMSSIVAEFDRDRMKGLAQHFADKPWPGTGYRVADADAARGESATIAGQCVQCHLGGYEGNSRIPRLAGQQVPYLSRTMLDFKNRTRLNSAAKGALLGAYGDEEIEDMARFIGGM